MLRERPTLLVISHPNVVTHNQLVYVRLAELGWNLHLIVPHRWRDEYSPAGFVPVAAPGLSGTFTRVRIARPGRHQRHVYLTRPSRWLRRMQPDALFLEQEPFSVPTLQWGLAAERLGIPWGVQGDDNVDRPLPWPARAIRRWAMPRAHYFAARSPEATEILGLWGARAPIAVVPHTIPEWPRGERAAGGTFTVGYVGRLVPEKGIDDLVAAARRLEFDFRLLVVGDGPLRERVQRTDLGRGTLDLRTGIRSDGLPELYRSMDVLVLPSRTTATWAEQFGKVLCEALLCGTPVIGSSSGAIPWVIETTGGGVVFPEGDPGSLAAAIASLREAEAPRRELAERGCAAVWREFSPQAAAAALDALLRHAIGGRPPDADQGSESTSSRG
jgi:glycosyltransferase involved in cell wall biosynthesis